MRPLRLELEGFSTFRSPTSVSFEGADLVAFVGSTGSGKSSLIDGITFALYGSVSRYDDLRVVEPVIHKLATEAKVRLDFELNTERYASVRVVRRQVRGGATTKEARLVRFEADGSETTLAGTAREMTDAVHDLLGLDFEQFTRTVVLPQGEFAAFLHEDKGKRQQLLRQLLDVGIYERMGQLARRRKAEADAKAGVLREQVDARTLMTDEALQVLEERANALEEFGTRLFTTLERIRALDAEAVACEPQLKDLDAQVLILVGIGIPPTLAELGPRIEAALRAVDEAASALEQSRANRSKAQEHLVGAGEPTEHRAVLDALQRGADIDSSLTSKRQEAAKAQELEAAAHARARELAEVLRVAVADLDAARHEAGLGAVIESLEIGEPCPVCRQVVHAMPAHDVDARLAAAKRTHADALASSSAADKAASAASVEASAISMAVRTLEGEREQLLAVIPAGADQATVEKRIAEADKAKAAFTDALAAVDQAEAKRSAAESAATAMRAEEQAARAELALIRDQVAARRPPTLAGVSLAEEWHRFAQWAQAEAKVVEGESAQLRLRLEGLRAERDALAQAIEVECSSHGIDVPLAQVEAVVARAAAESRAAVAAERGLRQSIARYAEEITALEESAAIHGELGRLLAVDGFERWLLQAALDGIVERATDRLHELSSGQYSLEADEGEFWIRDHHNADERRSVRTLSGGETFLASLALALALADNIAELAVEGGPGLESMFLDEGFGSLDPDTLDVVATAIEELSTTGRLIGIVTHIRDLADRMPVTYEVRKGSVSATVERIEA